MPLNLVNKSSLFLYKTAVLSDPRLKELSAQPSFAAKIRFADANFTKLKAGSGRIAYDYSSDLVLKLAKNEKGQAQNRVEADNFLQTNYKDLVANVVDSDPDDIWIVSEKASMANAAAFKSFTGVDFKNFCNYIINKSPVGNNSFKLPVTDEDALNNNEFVGDVLDMMSNFQMPAGDLTRIRSWGQVRGRVVLIDYGLTQDIYEQYYK